MNDQEKYALFTKAKETGGPCEICGWKDGDGTRTCFYGKELGIVRHENSEKGIMSTMDESQKHLYQLRQDLVYISEELREKQIAHVVYQHHQYEEQQRALHPDRPPTVERDGKTPISEEAWVARYRAEQMKKGLATDSQFASWIQEPWWIPVESGGRIVYLPEHRGIEKTETLPYTGNPLIFTAYMVHIYEPHMCGKGRKVMREPYYFACTGCDTEIKLWEHGVDYDVG